MINRARFSGHVVSLIAIAAALSTTRCSTPDAEPSGAGASAAAGSSGTSRGGGGAGTGGESASGAGGAVGTGGSAGSNGGDAGPKLGKIVAGYYPNWPDSPPRIRDVDAAYNLIYLFAATPVGGAPGTTGAVTWTLPGDGKGAATNFNADLTYARAMQGRKIVLSVGGAGNGMSFPNRAKSQEFVDSVVGLYGQFGGFDGIDWDTFEGDQLPDTSEMIWISLQLKSLYPGFLITAPPAPWRDADKAFCSQMVQAGALDYAAPQYYDGPNLATQTYLVTSIDAWASLLGEGKLVIGFGIWDQPNYWSIGDAVAAWNQVKANHPNLRGAFDWQIDVDESEGWPFAHQLGPLVEP